MPHLTALAIEGALIDATGGDWLRDLLGLLRHGRWAAVCAPLCSRWRACGVACTPAVGSTRVPLWRVHAAAP
jgi:hypothetical protein